MSAWSSTRCSPILGIRVSGGQWGTSLNTRHLEIHEVRVGLSAITALNSCGLGSRYHNLKSAEIIASSIQQTYQITYSPILALEGRGTLAASPCALGRLADISSRQ